MCRSIIAGLIHGGPSLIPPDPFHFRLHSFEIQGPRIQSKNFISNTLADNKDLLPTSLSETSGDLITNLHDLIFLNLVTRNDFL